MIEGAVQEFEGMDLGDRRRTRRLVRSVEAIERSPQASFPKALGSRAASEAWYRLINSDEVQHDRLMRHVVERTASRIGDHDGAVLVLHDTTEASWPGVGTRSGLTQRGAQQKLWLQTCLAVAETGPPQVLGLLANHPYIQEEGVWYRVLDQKDGEENTYGLRSGSERWLQAATEAHGDVPKEAGQLIHVMDREGDAFDLIAELSARSMDFVIRSAHDRRGAEGKKLRALLEETKVSATREVVLTARSVDGKPPRATQGFPARGARNARLSIRFAPFDIKAPEASQTRSKEPVSVWVVEAVEENPPPGQAPIRWRLLTSLAVTSAEEALRVIDIYRRRWIIEEFFKALKTGCALEERQANSLRTVCDTIAILLPIAVGLLNLRAVARDTSSASADLVVNPRQLQILKQVAPERLPKRGRITARHVLLAVAAFGGHFKSNGEPGWQTLAKGWQKLKAHEQGFEAGWRAAMAFAERSSRESASADLSGRSDVS